MEKRATVSPSKLEEHSASGLSTQAGTPMKPLKKLKKMKNIILYVSLIFVEVPHHIMKAYLHKMGKRHVKENCILLRLWKFADHHKGP